MDKYAYVFLISLKEFRTYILDFISRFIYFPIEFGFFYLLFFVVYANRPSIAGFSFNMIILYSFSSVVLQGILPFRIALEVEEDIVDGDLINWLIKPMNYSLLIFFYHLAKALFRFILGLLTYFVASILFSSFSIFNTCLFIFSTFFSFTFVYLFCYIIGLSAFWIGRNYWLRNLLMVAILILGGGLIPISWFPTTISTLLQLLPFQFTLYIPASLASGSYVAHLEIIFLKMVIWIVVLGIVSILLWRRGKRMFEATGG